jgi:hypothetical protein
MTKRQTFATTIAVLFAAYDKPLTDLAVEAYWLALERLDPTELATVMRRALAEAKFMPTPSELLTFAGKGRNVAAEGALAWQAVRRAIDAHDYSVGSIDFGPRVNAVLRNLGGWDTLCRATLGELDNPGWLRKRFEEVYGLFSETHPDRLNGDPLPGPLEARGRADVRVAIEGQPAPRQIGPAGRAGAGVLELLAEEKSA